MNPNLLVPITTEDHTRLLQMSRQPLPAHGTFGTDKVLVVAVDMYTCILCAKVLPEEAFMDRLRAAVDYTRALDRDECARQGLWFPPLPVKKTWYACFPCKK